MCVLENVSVGLGAFSDKTATDVVMERYKKSAHEDEAYIHFHKG